MPNQLLGTGAVRGLSMIAVVFVCMSLHVFGCETEVVNATARPDVLDKVEAPALQVGALAARPRPLSTPEQPSAWASSLTSSTAGESASSPRHPQSAAAQSATVPGPSADWEPIEEMNRTAAVEGTRAAAYFEPDEALTPQTTS